MRPDFQSESKPQIQRNQVRKSRSLILIATFVAGILLGFLDFLTGPFLQFPFFFLLPIGFAAWNAGRPAGITLAFLLPLARPLIWYPIWRRGIEAGVAGQLMGLHVLVLNAFIKILMFTLFAEMTHRISTAARFREQVISAMPIGVWVADRNGVIIQASPAGRMIWGGGCAGRHSGVGRNPKPQGGIG